MKLPPHPVGANHDSTAFQSWCALIVKNVNDLITEGTSLASYALNYDYIDATTSYLGEAAPGTATSAAAWRIKELTFTGDDVTILYADGNSSFDNVWDDRASLSYS